MNHGDGKDRFLSEKENPQSMRKRKKLGADEFAQAIARNVVAQICESLGFHCCHQSALDNLADVAVRYIQDVGKTASSYANLASRTQCNVFDLIQGLEDLGSVQGFSGASNVRRSLSGSGVVKDIIRYVSLADDIPFAYSIPVFPVVRERVLDRSFAQAEENPADKHIPSWLPKFPDPLTYAELSSGNEKNTETEAVKMQQIEEKHREAETERSLLNLQQKLMCNGSEAGVVVEQGDAAKAQRAAENNPFLATPLQFWEKEVSLPTLPARFTDESLGYHQSHEDFENRVSIMEPSSQANEAARSGPCEPEDKRNIPLNGRPNVQFQFGNVKNSLSVVRNPQNRGAERTSPWFGDYYDGADEKKGTTEKILLENTEYPPELSNV